MTQNHPLPPQAGDDLDGTLRAFFQAQMPNPWPKAPSLAVSLRPFRARRPRFTLLRSRAALAASVALMLFGSLWLSGRFDLPSSAESPPDLQVPTARDLFPHRSRKPAHPARPQPPAPEHEGGPVKMLDPMDLPPMK